MAEKQSREGNVIFASKQKQAHMKLVLSSAPGSRGTALPGCQRRQSAPGCPVPSPSRSSVCPVFYSHSQDRCHGWHRLLLGGTPNYYRPVPGCGPEGERLPWEADAIAAGGWGTRFRYLLQMLFPSSGQRVSPTTLCSPASPPSLSSQGEFFSLAHRSAVPFPPLALAFPPDHDRMVYFGASSYFFNTAGFAYHGAGALVFEITDSLVSSAGGMVAVPTPPGRRFSLHRSSGSSLWSQRVPPASLTSCPEAESRGLRDGAAAVRHGSALGREG